MKFSAVNISVMIPTKNEERDLPGCLESVSWSDDIHVYDSGSSDGTRQVAARYGAKFVQPPGADRTSFFGGDESAHKNWALANIPFKHTWVFHIDADERVTSDLARNLAARVEEPGETVAFRVQRRDFFQGRWLRHVQASPYYIRLFRPDRMRYERLINPVSIVDGPIGEVDGYLDHFPFSKGMAHWLLRHNAYSTMEAEQIVANRLMGVTFDWHKTLFARDFSERRFHQKELFYRLPMRPLIKFLLLYVGKRGFLDGSAGFTYACLQSIYEYMIVLKTRELADQKKQ